MKREEVLNMPAGREMDALIAEKVFGWWWSSDGEIRLLVPPKDDKRITWAAEWSPEGLPHWLSNYSTDIAAAWEVVEKVNQDNHMELRWNNPDGRETYFVCEFGFGKKFKAVAASAPLAICRAALLSERD